MFASRCGGGDAAIDEATYMMKQELPAQSLQSSQITRHPVVSTRATREAASQLRRHFEGRAIMVNAGGHHHMAAPSTGGVRDCAR
jgi:hypothetical protein